MKNTETNGTTASKKAARKTSTKTSTKKPTARRQTAEPAPVAPFTPEAWAYLSKASIEGVKEAPIFFIGGRLALDILAIRGVPMDLEEAKLLVVPDGEPRICALTGETFQPVKYVPFISKQMEEGLKDGKRLDEIDLWYGGAYYIDHKKNVTALSGPVFFYNGRENQYQYAKSSPLIVMAQEMRRKYGQMVWGVPLDVVDAQSASRARSHERHNKAAELVKGGLIRPRRNNVHRDDFGALPQDALANLSRAGRRCKDRKPKRLRHEDNGE